MMAKRTLQQVLSQIETLKKEADLLRSKEAQGVIDRIKEAIAHYGLTEADLFPKAVRGNSPNAKVGKGKRGGRAAGTAKAKPTPGVPKYADPTTGKTWTGQGKRPVWFKQAIESGKPAEELLIKAL